MGSVLKWLNKEINLKLKLGFSHEATYKVPKGINIKIEKQTKLNISGTDKALVSKTSFRN